VLKKMKKGEIMTTRLSFTAKVGRFGTKKNYHSFQNNMSSCDVKDLSR
jgi:hypothetical protein